MTSTIKVNTVKDTASTDIIKKCGTTTTIGSGASNPIVVDGSAVTLGRCGGTVALASGATQTGFGRTGTVDWQTGSIKTATFTAVSGDGFFANTSGSAFNMNLPAGVAGAIVSVADYAATWQTNALTVVPNGSDKIGGVSGNVTLSTAGQSVTFIFVDSTQGWVNTMDSTSNARAASFITATGGTITTSGDCKIHTFTGPGTFTVCATAGLCGPTRNLVSYVVVAGGGGGGGSYGGGGGAGGFREVVSPSSPYTGSPLNGYPSAPNRITVTAAAFPITVGGGGGGGTFPGAPYQGSSGSNSIFSTITSAGGGGGATEGGAGVAGGSGGGGSYGPDPGGAGNTPPTTPAQGQTGGAGGPTSPYYTNGGGGGAGEVGVAGSTSSNGRGAVGVTSSITASSLSYAGGGGAGGGDNPDNGAAASPCGTGGKGSKSSENPSGFPGTTNRGGGGGGSKSQAPGAITGGNGGSGIVIIRYKFQ